MYTEQVFPAHLTDSSELRKLTGIQKVVLGFLHERQTHPDVNRHFNVYFWILGSPYLSDKVA